MKTANNDEQKPINQCKGTYYHLHLELVFASAE